MEREILIFDIERFSIHDGPGIRTTVFFKGCPLRCPWCANPESWEMRPVVMRIDSKCVGCGSCAAVCSAGAIRMKGGKVVFERRGCVACGSCVRNCPNGALHISGRFMSVSEIMEIVLRDVDYYKNSGGGLTLSGGEPLMQGEGAAQLLGECKRNGLHTAIETTGNVPLPDFQRGISLVDLFLFDVKHWDAAILRRVTGGDLDLILENLRSAVKAGREVIIRLPVIPGFNHSSEDIGRIFDLAVRYGVSKVHLLPYHTLGVDKFRQLGMEYPYERGFELPEKARTTQKPLHERQLGMMNPQQLEPFRELGRNRGLDIII